MSVTVAFTATNVAAAVTAASAGTASDPSIAFVTATAGSFYVGTSSTVTPATGQLVYAGGPTAAVNLLAGQSVYAVTAAGSSTGNVNLSPPEGPPLSPVGVSQSGSPLMQGLWGQTFDPAAVQTTFGPPVSGTLYLARIRSVSTQPATGIALWINNAGAGLTAGQNFVGLLDANGNRLAVSADQSTAFATTGGLKIPFLSPVPVVVGVDYYAAFLTNFATTAPLPLRGIGGPGVNLFTGPSNPMLTTLAGQTSIPASVTLSATTPLGASLHIGGY